MTERCELRRVPTWNCCHPAVRPYTLLCRDGEAERCQTKRRCIDARNGSPMTSNKISIMQDVVLTFDSRDLAHTWTLEILPLFFSFSAASARRGLLFSGRPAVVSPFSLSLSLSLSPLFPPAWKTCLYKSMRSTLSPSSLTHCFVTCSPFSRSPHPTVSFTWTSAPRLVTTNGAKPPSFSGKELCTDPSDYSPSQTSRRSCCSSRTTAVRFDNGRD
ncbi:hypothetical protein IWX49DRAFT_584354 [Phyllosticta citricarpa]